MAAPSRQQGFTMIELVTVMMLIGILAVVAIPRFSDTTFRDRGFHDAVVAAIAHGRRVAVASRRFVCVGVDGAAGRVSLTRDERLPENVAAVSCTATLALPATSGGCPANAVCAPSGVTLNGGTSTSLIFDPLGRPVTAPGAPLTTLTTLSTPHGSVTIHPETGYVK